MDIKILFLALFGMLFISGCSDILILGAQIEDTLITNDTTYSSYKLNEIFQNLSINGTITINGTIDNYSKITISPLEFIGSGVGSTKTTSGIYQNTIYEGFGIGDEIYGQWIIPQTIDTSKAATVVFKFFVEASEIDKKANFSFKYTMFDGNKQINVTTITTSSGDFSVSSTPYEVFEYKLLLDLPSLSACIDNCVVNGIIQRVSSSNDYLGDINLISMYVSYYDIFKYVNSGNVTTMQGLDINQSIIGYNGNDKLNNYINYATTGDFIDTHIYYDSNNTLSYAIQNQSGILTTIDLTYTGGKVTEVTYN